MIQQLAFQAPIGSSRSPKRMFVWRVEGTNARNRVRSRTTESAVLPKWAHVDQALQQWSTLNPDWDGNGSPTPHKGAVAFLEAIAAIARGKRVPEPRAYFAADGEVGFRWSNGSAKGIVSIRPNGALLGFAHSSAATVRITNDRDWAQNKDKFIAALGNIA